MKRKKSIINYIKLASDYLIRKYTGVKFNLEKNQYPIKKR